MDRLIPKSMAGLLLGLIFFSFHNFSAARTEDEGPSDSPLIRALVERDEIHVRNLLDGGASPNKKDRFGSTPLGAAITAHLLGSVELLIKKGADVNLSEEKNTSPLMQAAWGCDLKIAKLLVNDGANVRHKDQDGETALSFAAYSCRDGEMIKFLLANGALINERNQLGETPLIHAAFEGNEPAVVELLQAGADTTIKDQSGESAEMIACGRQIGRKKDHDRACSLLRNAETR